MQTRILKVKGTEVGAGENYNVISDVSVTSSVLDLIDKTWDELRPHLVETRFQEDARFKTTYLYPELACREALVNAIAHRDYSDEGRGVEIYVFEDRIEIVSPGGLLSSISVKEITSLTGVHQSRNSYVARALREVGLMRELGEGMRRIFEVMKHSELAPPEIESTQNAFRLILQHRPMYNQEEILWLEQFESLDLSAGEKAVLLLGRRGDLIAPNDIFRRLGIVDTDHYRQIIEDLQKKGVLESTVSRRNVQKVARNKGVGVRDFPRYRVIEQRRSGAGRRSDSIGQARQMQLTVNPNSTENASFGIFIANIPPNTMDRDLLDVFSEFGEVASVRIPKSLGLSKGYAFVDFEESEAVQKALAGGASLGGRRLTIRHQKPVRRNQQ